MKAEKILTEFNTIRKDLEEDKSDIEWLTLHHAFCFISYKMGEFQTYLDVSTHQLDGFEGRGVWSDRYRASLH